MATDLADLVDSLKREVAVPGTFASVFPNTTDTDLEGTLLDAFAQVQLDGFLLTNGATDEGLVTPDLSRAAQALVVVYAGIRILTTELLNRRSHTRYEAGGAVFEQDQGASILVQALKGLQDKRTSILAQAKDVRMTDVTVVDGYYVKATEFYTGEIGSGVLL